MAADICDPLKRSNKDHEYILTMQCLLTKFCVSILLKNIESRTIAEKFVKRFVCVFGVPSEFLMDNGKSFVSSLMKHVAKRFRMKHIRTTSHHLLVTEAWKGHTEEYRIY